MNTNTHLKIFQLSHPGMNTEWLAILGDKYQGTLNLSWTLVDEPDLANVIVWDGVLTPKLTPRLGKILEGFSHSRVLLLVGEALTALKNHPLVKLVDLENIKFVEISGWGILPEEILGAIELCHQKLKDV